MGKRNSFTVQLVPILFLVTTICIFIPSTLYIGNTSEFLLPYFHAAIYLFGSAAVAFFVLVLAAWLIRKNKALSNIMIDLVFGFALGAYVQFSFLNTGLGQLNGKDVAWDYSSFEAITSTIVWIICLITPHVIRRISSSIAQKICMYGSMALTAMQVISLALTLIFSSETVPTNYVLTKNKEFELSSQKNIIVFIVDTLDAQWAEKYIIDDPQYSGLLDGYTYFDNVVSGGAPTELGLPTLLTGEIYDISVSRAEYVEQANKNSKLIADLSKNQFVTKLYTNISYLQGTDFEQIENASVDAEFRIADPVRFLKDMYKFTAYAGMPYIAKSYFHFYSGALTNNISTTSVSEDLYLIDDPQFYQDYVSQGISLNDQKNIFVLYHLFGAHGPCSMNENAERVDENQTSLQQQIQGVMKIISEFTEEMKQKGIYDSSTIIICADHGGVALYQNPAVFIKKAYSAQPFTVNSAPLTFRNLRATFVEDFVDHYQDTYGYGMFEVEENADIPYRPHTYRSVLHKEVFSDQAILESVEFLTCNIGNPARDNSLILTDEYSLYNDYVVGSVIHLAGEETVKDYLLEGFHGVYQDYRWTKAKKARIPLHIIGDHQDLAFTMKYKTYNGAQPVRLFVNDHLVFDDVLQGGGEMNPVVIPKEYVEDDKIELVFELPGAVSPKELGVGEDSTPLAISIESFSLTSVEHH